MAKIIDVAAISGMVMERGEESPREALRQFDEGCEKLKGTGVDLVVTCETMMMNQAPGTGEDPAHPGELLEAYSSFARENNCTVAGALRTMYPDGSRQSLVYYGPSGEYLGVYHKMFPTQAALAKGTIPGKGAVAVDTPAGRLGGALCFDLNFDELRDEYIPLQLDILCFSSYFHGGPILGNWAFRTRSFAVGAIKDLGSEIYDPLGRRINVTTYYNRIARDRINLDRVVLHGDGNCEKYPDIMRKYGKKVLIDQDSPSAYAILYSTSEETSAAGIAEEFGLITAENFLNACRQARQKALL